MNPVAPKFSGVIINRVLAPNGTLGHYSFDVSDKRDPDIRESEVQLRTTKGGKAHTQSLGNYQQAGQLTQTLTEALQMIPTTRSSFILPAQAKRFLSSLINQLAQGNKLPDQEADIVKVYAQAATQALPKTSKPHTLWFIEGVSTL